MDMHNLTEYLRSRTRALEILLVKHGLKRVARISTEDEKGFKKLISDLGLNVVFSDYKIRMEFTGGYSTKGTIAGKNEKGHSFAYISRRKSEAENAREADANQNIAELGRILGYPECCIEFFISNRKEEIQRRNDYILPALENSLKKRHPFHLNVFARYFDFALISHAPHSLDCRSSVAIARQSMNLLFKEDPATAMAYQKAMNGTGIYGEDFVLLLPGGRIRRIEGRTIIEYGPVFSSPTESEAANILRGTGAALIETKGNSIVIRTERGSVTALALEEFE